MTERPQTRDEEQPEVEVEGHRFRSPVEEVGEAERQMLNDDGEDSDGEGYRPR
jgi:hypothetical protein